VEYEPWMFIDPFESLGMLMSGIVVDDDMNRFAPGHLGIDDVEKADELLMAMTLPSNTSSAANSVVTP
jgi:hypothetical protein